MEQKNEQIGESFYKRLTGLEDIDENKRITYFGNIIQDDPKEAYRKIKEKQPTLSEIFKYCKEEKKKLTQLGEKKRSKEITILGKIINEETILSQYLDKEPTQISSCNLVPSFMNICKQIVLLSQAAQERTGETDLEIERNKKRIEQYTNRVRMYNSQIEKLTKRTEELERIKNELSLI